LKRKRRQDGGQKQTRPENENGATHPKRITSGESAQGLSYRPLSRPRNLNNMAVTTPFPSPSTSLTTERGWNRSSTYEEPYLRQRQPDRASIYPSHSSHSSLYNPQQQAMPGYRIPSQSYPVYDRPMQSPTAYSLAPLNDEYPSRGPVSSLPPGAYVNPAFFNRPSLPAQVPQDIQLMDFLQNARQSPEG
jgi:hypothetical protein